MGAERRQTTLKTPCTVSGRGYWTGQPNTLTFLPAVAGTGVRFVRTDLDGHPSVSVCAENRVSMPLRTRLSRGRAEVDMVEHVLAALYGLQIDNVLINCTSSEMPAMDGSSLAFSLALLSAGRVELDSTRRTLSIPHTLRVGNNEQWIVAEPPADQHSAACLELEYQLDFGSQSPINAATYRWQLQPQKFLVDVAAARTFISFENARWLQSQGLARHVTEQDILVFDQHGPVNNRLRYPDECARHKLLDLLGDLALAGLDLVGRVTAHRGGHQLNGEMADQLCRLADHLCLQSTPQTLKQSA